MIKFNLEKALNGEAVVDGEGNPVTDIHLFSAKDTHPVYGIVNGEICSWSKEGIFLDCNASNNNIYMAPISKSGWINILADVNHVSLIFNTKEDAIQSIPDDYDKRVITHYIEWEE